VHHPQALVEVSVEEAVAAAVAEDEAVVETGTTVELAKTRNGSPAPN